MTDRTKTYELKEWLRRKIAYPFIGLVALALLAVLFSPNPLLSQWVVYSCTAAFVILIVAAVLRSWRYILFYRIEEDIDYTSPRFTTPDNFSKLSDKAHKAGLNNQPLPQTLVQSVNSGIRSRHQIFMQHYEEVRPNLARQCERLHSLCTAQYTRNGDLSGYHTAPVSLGDVYQTMMQNPANDNGRGKA